MAEPDVGVDETTETPLLPRWVSRGIWTVVIAGNALLVWDAWKRTPAGVAFAERVRAKMEKLKNCEPCAKRREWLKARSHMLFDAHQAVHGAEIETAPDVVPPATP